MKHSLFLCAIALASMNSAYAVSKTNLYGSIKAELNDGTLTRKDNTKFNLGTSASFGFVGQEDLSNGLQAIFKMDLKVTDKGISQTNDMYLGLKGKSFGELTLGRQNTLWNGYVKYANIFNSSVFFRHGFSNSGRLSHVVKYLSPNMAGFTIGGAVVIDGKNEGLKKSDSKGIDAWDLGAQYNANGIKFATSYYVQDEGRGKRELIGFSGGYSNKDFKVGGGYSHESSAADYYTFAGQYRFGDNTVRAGVAYFNQPHTKKGDAMEYALGYQYNLSQRTYLWAEASYEDLLQKGALDKHRFYLGIKHNF